MRRISLSRHCRDGLTAFVAASPAQAAFHLIRWQDSGFCQIWDETVPTTPWPGNYIVIQGSQVPTFGDALVYKDGLLRSRACAF
jgi:hypothetical protein